MDNTNLVAFGDLGEWDIGDSTTIDSLLSYRVCMSENPKISKSAQYKDLQRFIRAQNRNFHHQRYLQDGYSSNWSTYTIRDCHKPRQYGRHSHPPQKGYSDGITSQARHMEDKIPNPEQFEARTRLSDLAHHHQNRRAEQNKWTGWYDGHPR